MNQSLTSRLVVLALSVVLTSILFESVAELRRPAGDGEVQVAEAAQVQASPPSR